MNIADEAKQLVLGDRNAAYGDPRADYEATAKIWSGILAGKLKAEITPEDAILMMIGVKLSRLSRNPAHRDSVVDIIGYSLCHSWATTGVKPE